MGGLPWGYEGVYSPDVPGVASPGRISSVGRAVMARKKHKRCRSCKKSPVWRGGDVKDPGPYCKRCYHKQTRPPLSSPTAKTDTPSGDPDYEHCPECGVEADVCGGGTCPNCRFEFNNALYWWF